MSWKISMKLFILRTYIPIQFLMLDLNSNTYETVWVKEQYLKTETKKYVCCNCALSTCPVICITRMREEKQQVNFRI